eukprot:CAMPEP_0117774224 /NCGR_PEP_ID=MMETSP0947-20121206/26372_1 /TAXON_ID=44440 /ORGANISM="Chattonella subsalsa, Strain CCMP2191" /LENGTH=54 /DNA_ID=CAMNT_0005600613 /DNA_START=57 /DNA_END=217 /DNA_ORIENTATION=-
MAEELDTSLPFFLEFVHAQHIIDTIGHRDMKIICKQFPESPQIRRRLKESRIEV